ncbi:WhiB family transcriptional regulator [Streptomyces flavofungini]|uniref:WhiB family transcriptional regulator n=1 Tax=Streptomyces flavofungini TaxID=68200 RepID=UPI0025AF6FDB|nr:WhiB family transcriptional regulator [Streptomyces flavofungini]WJV51777.1 WhiB family transcriptional regulator [Streptomyces flavofungini]
MNRHVIVRTSNYGPVTPNVVDQPRPLCADDPELFFPIGETGPALLQIEEAKAVCHSGCPLLESCLRTALDRNEFGVWGGTGEDERRAMKRRAARQRTAHTGA